MQTSTTNPSSTDIDDVTRTEAELAARTARLAQSPRQGEKSGQKTIQNAGHELKPAVIAGIAVAALATVAGVAVAISRRSGRSRWLPPQRPSALGKAARGAGMLLLRMLARQVASQIVARLDGAPATSGAPTASHAAQPPLRQ
jgi:hypothetical protein